MAIWLSSEQASVGPDVDVIRSAELANVIALDQAYGALEQRYAGLLAEAEATAQAIVAAAQQRADTLETAAQRRFDNSARLGYAAGRRRGLEEVHALMLRQAASQHQLLCAARERIVQIVTGAVERVLGAADPKALFTQVAGTVDRLLADSSFLTVQVAPQDLDAARAAFGTACSANQWGVNPQVAGRVDLAPGSCLCEWDYGVIDGSLSLHLDALRRAVAGLVAEPPSQFRQSREEPALEQDETLDQHESME
ncbi:type III secretion system stator protein SctL [Collimonas fungivorans]|uniref:Type 3 secretion system stator protein n=1 Tax=Collimonas fungivorans (strain Ter331) TaxID=1005048 RepID=G0AFR9_COLFT|nr:type III secretion system stator protein SctL [Collimonas fungivorans]AEK64158.1 Type III secretion inner membrane protein SctL [Collimonas fungivorans Ter331]